MKLVVTILLSCLVSLSVQFQYGGGIPYGDNQVGFGVPIMFPYVAGIPGHLNPVIYGGQINSPYGINNPGPLTPGIYGSPLINPYGNGIPNGYPGGVGLPDYNPYGQPGGNLYGMDNHDANSEDTPHGPDNYLLGKIQGAAAGRAIRNRNSRRNG